MIRIIKVSDDDYRIQERTLFWWCFTLRETKGFIRTESYSSFQEAHRHAILYIRANGSVLCKTIKPAYTIEEILTDA